MSRLPRSLVPIVVYVWSLMACSGEPVPSPTPAETSPTPEGVSTSTPMLSSPTPEAVTPTPTLAPTATPTATPTPTPEPTPEPTVAPEQPLLVETSGGPVLGQLDDEDTVSWLGLPFAAPPVGALRWRAPQDPTPWTETRNADAFSPPCAQLVESDADGDGETELGPLGDEDCLYLNVWRPRARAGEKRPVMVWIHGGANVQGSSSVALYEGSRLSSRGDVLLVTLQYRLSFWGYVYHEALRNGDPLTDSGNFGTLDIIKALQWVQDNAEAFGGDPSRVTIFGESAGGVNVWSMLMSPLAEGLFHAGIVESGCYSSDTPERARERAQGTLEGMVVADGLTTAEEAASYLNAQGTAWITTYLSGKTQEELLAYFAAAGGFGISEYKPVRDGVVYSNGGEDDLITGSYNRVPLIIGANRDEQKAFYASYSNMKEAQYNLFMQALFGDDQEAVEALYPRSSYDPDTPYNQLTDILDLTFEPICSELAAWIIAPHQPTYLYHFRYDRLINPYDYVYGAAHAFELPFVFGYVESSLYPSNALAERETLSRGFMQYWSCLAHTGNPSCSRTLASVPTWKPVGQSVEQFERMVLDDVVVPEVMPRINIERINFWTDYYNLPFAPIPLP